MFDSVATHHYIYFILSFWKGFGLGNITNPILAFYTFSEVLFLTKGRSKINIVLFWFFLSLVWLWCRKWCFLTAPHQFYRRKMGSEERIMRFTPTPFDVWVCQMILWTAPKSIVMSEVWILRYPFLASSLQCACGTVQQQKCWNSKQISRASGWIIAAKTEKYVRIRYHHQEEIVHIHTVWQRERERTAH